MSDTYQPRKTRPGRPEPEPRQDQGVEREQEPTTDASGAGGSPAGAHGSHVEDEAESIRSGSQTAQDRDHTIRGGDDHTGPMKEFPT
jgi:hypothetical protein